MCGTILTFTLNLITVINRKCLHFTQKVGTYIIIYYLTPNDNSLKNYIYKLCPHQRFMNLYYHK